MAAALAIALTAVMTTASAASAASLRVEKQTEPDGDQTEFTFSYEGVKEGDGSPADSGTFTLKDGESWHEDVAHGIYTVKEETPSGWKVVDIVCDNDDDPQPEDAPQIDISGGQATLQISPSEDKGCVFTNRKSGTLRIKKATSPAGSTTPFTFDVSTSLGSPFTIADQGIQEYTVEPGSYQVTERTTDGWTLTGGTCDDGDSSWTGATLTANVGAGEVVTCTFNNSQNPVAVPEQPRREVLPQPPVRQRSAAARLVAPKRCVSRRYTVAVSGSPVRSVSFWVNGKRVRTVRARTGQRRFTVTLPINRAVARVRARVQFANDATPSARVLRATIRRCAPAAVRPKFTG
jgi:hypothetical protein